MPVWLGHWLLPVVIQVLTPFLVQCVKNAVSWLKVKLPDSVLVVLAGAVGEGMNQAQGYLTGGHLPPGAGGLITILVNEALTDLSQRERVPVPVPADAKVLGPVDKVEEPPVKPMTPGQLGGKSHRK